MNFNDENACSSSGSVLKMSSISETKVDLFPNPSQSIVTITINSNSDQSFSIQLYNVLGNIVKTSSVSGRGIDQQLDVSDLSRGIYFYNIESLNEKVNGYLILN